MYYVFFSYKSVVKIILKFLKCKKTHSQFIKRRIKDDYFISNNSKNKIFN